MQYVPQLPRSQLNKQEGLLVLVVLLFVEQPVPCACTSRCARFTTRPAFSILHVSTESRRPWDRWPFLTQSGQERHATKYLKPQAPLGTQLEARTPSNQPVHLFRQ